MKSGFSGKMLLRLDPALHRRLAQRARERRVSVNRLCADLLERGLRHHEDRPWWEEGAKAVTDLLRRHFGAALLGVAVFGSQVQGSATESSDVDFLIVLSGNEPLQRSLYTWWDHEVHWEGPSEASPQFVHLPENSGTAGGIWLEAALASRILWERGRSLSSMLDALRRMIEAGAVRRFWNNGQPYWVRRGDEEQGSGA